MYACMSDICAASLPPRGLKLRPVPFVAKTELADIREFHQGKDGLIYLVGVVSLKAASQGRLLYGADGPVKVWVNRKAAGCVPDATNPARIAEYSCDVKWKKGRNELIFALNTNHGKAWGVLARVSRK